MNVLNPGEGEILIAEDSPTQAEKLRYILERNNYRAIVTRNGRQALTLVRQRRPAMVITDVLMPEMDGYQLCREIRADSDLKNLPVILLTSLANAEDVLKGLECGADNFITKPYDETYLLNRIRHVFANSQLQDFRSEQTEFEVIFGGKRHVIRAGRQQILNLLLSTYETAVQRNEALTKTQDELRTVNDRLAKQSNALEQANREMEAFSYSVSHDLRAPLRAIGSFTQFIIEDFSHQLEEEGKDYLSRIAGSVDRMNHLIDDLLKLFGVTSGKINRQLVDLSQIAGSIAEELHRSQPERNVEIAITPGIQVHGDPSLLRVVMENLLNNAWKFTSKVPNACIEVGLVHEDGKPLCFVRDNGAGFNMQMAERLFAPFQRLHSNADFAGSGIGLATVQRIIHRHGGKIWAESEPGKGAAFYFAVE